MNSDDISLGEFVKQLTVRFDQQGMTMPLRDEKSWHVLFYKLRSPAAQGERPAFFNDLTFEWDGPYPRLPELADYIHGLHWTGCLSAANPQYEEMTLNRELSQRWSAADIEPGLRTFIDNAVELARREFAVR